MESKLTPLHRFYNDQEIYNAVYEHLLNHLKAMAIEKSFAGDSTDGLKQAKTTLDNAFEQIKREFKPKEAKKENSTE